MREPELAAKVLMRELPKPDRTEVVLPAQLLAKLARSGVGLPSCLRRPTLRRYQRGTKGESQIEFVLLSGDTLG